MTTLYAATGDDVVRITSSDGTRWRTASVLAGVGAQCLALDPRDPARLFAGTFDRGLYRTRDGGRTWDEVSAGIPHRRVLSVAISPSDRPGDLGV
ncbi:MAG TPA: hypothetical protein VFN57_19015, partial [Thermomicrobiaceae bacterium]|nr:hypothetical protein [Thermomicrobiaceae bacterium]